ncbi:type IV pilus modification protein PilV [Comamonas sp. BIGb0124]|uniref:type IV pilus modification protein PilV n=1 Tax=Comamonas sp. BIGb0124 TaxID=2485130 RepID=UPI000F488398|nr:type IV pilus modification protein PilV [Comamonas sp. BIGb0124]ROR17010.1 type IV pilus modification protein PilV [Comamonas sp. BIGb0124]
MPTLPSAVLDARCRWPVARGRPGLGHALIEAVVAAFVFSVGALGLAGVQLHALSSARQTGQHLKAATLAADLADLIRQHPLQPPRPAAGAGGTAGNSEAQQIGASASAQTDCRLAACDAEQARTWRLAEWTARLQHALPGAQAQVCSHGHGGSPPQAGCAGAAPTSTSNPAAPTIGSLRLSWPAPPSIAVQTQDPSGLAPAEAEPPTRAARISPASAQTFGRLALPLVAER